MHAAVKDALLHEALHEALNLPLLQLADKDGCMPCMHEALAACRPLIHPLRLSDCIRGLVFKHAAGRYLRAAEQLHPALINLAPTSPDAA